MISRILSDESLEVLVFVCGPLALLLVGLIVLLIRGSRHTVACPSFSVTISRVGRESAHVIYRFGNKRLEFDAEIGRGKSFFTRQISVRVPKDMSEEDVRKVVPNLAWGLTKLRYQYLIYRLGEPLEIPQQTREEAIAELRKINIEVRMSQDKTQILKTAAPYWRRVLGVPAKTSIPQLLNLLTKVRGVREQVEVLARSDSGRMDGGRTR
jgi:hypothetical protein